MSNALKRPAECVEHLIRLSGMVTGCTDAVRTEIARNFISVILKSCVDDAVAIACVLLQQLQDSRLDTSLQACNKILRVFTVLERGEACPAFLRNESQAYAL